MPYRRAAFVLTPPSLWIFIVSLVLAVVALLVHYAGVHIPMITTARAFMLLAVAYVLLAAGVLIRGV